MAHAARPAAPIDTDTATPDTHPWHARSAEAALSALGVTRRGLTDEEAQRRLDEHGPNRLPERKPVHPVLKFLRHYHNVLIYVLLAAAVVTALLDHWIDTWIILAVVVINGVIGYVQEGKAEKALEAVRRMLSLTARVERNGDIRERPAEAVVQGDLLHLRSGDKVPADMRLVTARELRIDEASLTGESEAVEKGVEPVAPEASLGDRSSMAYSGTLVVSGQGVGVVTATGEHTELGRINQMLAEVSGVTTPLLQQVGRFGRSLTLVILAAGAVTFAIGHFVRGMETSELFLAVVGLAVAAIPEGLPAILTITLAVGVQRMARRHAIVRRLPSVETLGSVSVICTDKTGTLTRGEMTATRVALADAQFEVSGAGYAPQGSITRDGETVDPDRHRGLGALLRTAALCNDARLLEGEGWTVEGTPTDGALLTLAAKGGMTPARLADDWPRLDTIPFESAHKFMATLHEGPDGPVVLLKGCAGAGAGPLRPPAPGPTATRRSTAPLWQRTSDELAASGVRLLALAVSAGAAGRGRAHDGVGRRRARAARDRGPARPAASDEAIAAVRECREAGIRVKMITGDHALTARAIAAAGRHHRRRCGRRRHRRELEAMSDDELYERAEDTDVFARVSPEHKLRLVTALQRRGRITAMTGDGVNDAPALKRADIGVAMGIKGTEASKEAAEMVLADDNFAHRPCGRGGRTVYDNLRKALLFILPTNGGESLVIIAAILFGLVLPITPVQILWVNMATAVTLALAMAIEPMEQDVMKRPPRRADESLTPPALLFRIAYVSALLTATTLGAYAWAKAQGWPVESARTLAVNMLVAGEVFYLFNARLIASSALTRAGLAATRWIWAAVGAVVVLQLAFTYVPVMQRLFGTAPIEAIHWAAIAVVNTGLFLAVEAEKAIIVGHRGIGRRPRPARAVLRQRVPARTRAWRSSSSSTCRPTSRA
jgi:magnesium-transporting ATPase (P-type)